MGQNNNIVPQSVASNFTSPNFIAGHTTISSSGGFVTYGGYYNPKDYNCDYCGGKIEHEKFRDKNEIKVTDSIKRIVCNKCLIKAYDKLLRKKAVFANRI